MRIRVLHKAGLPISGRDVRFGETVDATAVQAERLVTSGYAEYAREEAAQRKSKEAA